MLAVEEAGAWKAIEGSTVEGTTVKGPVSHFSKFSAIIIDGQVVAVSSCASTVSDFVDGGDVVGTWAWDDFCFRNQTLGSYLFDGKCPDARLDAEITRAGDVVISATTVTLGAATQTISVSGTVPVSCLPAGSTCDQFGKSVFKPTEAGLVGTCTTSGTSCSCSGPTEFKLEPAKAATPYTITGNTIKTGSDTANEYCVKGGKLYVSDKSEGGYVYVLRKK